MKNSAPDFKGLMNIFSGFGDEESFAFLCIAFAMLITCSFVFPDAKNNLRHSLPQMPVMVNLCK